MFARSGKAWSQRAKLTASDAAERDRFGLAVAVSGQTAVVGAFAKNQLTGAGYVFARSGQAWSQQAELTASGAAPGDRFGSSVAVSGKTALAGAPDKNSFTDAAYVIVGSRGTGRSSRGPTGTPTARPLWNAPPPAVCASSASSPNAACHGKLHVYVANLDTNTITSYPLTTSGGNVRPSATISASNGSLNHPANQTFDANRNLWVGNEESNTIVKFHTRSAGNKWQPRTGGHHLGQ